MLNHFCFLRPVLVGCPLKIGNMCYCQNNELPSISQKVAVGRGVAGVELWRVVSSTLEREDAGKYAVCCVTK